jgi:hypothetical protein
MLEDLTSTLSMQQQKKKKENPFSFAAPSSSSSSSLENNEYAMANDEDDDEDDSRLFTIVNPSPANAVELTSKLAGLTAVSAYALKYGEIEFDWPRSGNSVIAGAILLAFPLAVGAKMLAESEDLQEKVGVKNM